MIDNSKKKPTSRGDHEGIWDARLDFSATNNGKMTRCWAEAIQKKGDLQEVYRRACEIGGFRAKQHDNNITYESENDRANIESETDGAEEVDEGEE